MPVIDAPTRNVYIYCAQYIQEYKLLLLGGTEWESGTTKAQAVMYAGYIDLLSGSTIADDKLFKSFIKNAKLLQFGDSTTIQTTPTADTPPECRVCGFAYISSPNESRRRLYVCAAHSGKMYIYWTYNKFTPSTSPEDWVFWHPNSLEYVDRHYNTIDIFGGIPCGRISFVGHTGGNVDGLYNSDVATLVVKYKMTSTSRTRMRFMLVNVETNSLTLKDDQRLLDVEIDTDKFASLGIVSDKITGLLIPYTLSTSFGGCVTYMNINFRTGKTPVQSTSSYSPSDIWPVADVYTIDYDTGVILTVSNDNGPTSDSRIAAKITAWNFKNHSLEKIDSVTVFLFRKAVSATVLFRTAYNATFGYDGAIFTYGTVLNGNPAPSFTASDIRDINFMRGPAPANMVNVPFAGDNGSYYGSYFIAGFLPIICNGIFRGMLYYGSGQVDNSMHYVPYQPLLGVLYKHDKPEEEVEVPFIPASDLIGTDPTHLVEPIMTDEISNPGLSSDIQSFSRIIVPPDNAPDSGRIRLMKLGQQTASTDIKLTGEINDPHSR